MDERLAPCIAHPTLVVAVSAVHQPARGFSGISLAVPPTDLARSHARALDSLSAPGEERRREERRSVLDQMRKIGTDVRHDRG